MKKAAPKEKSYPCARPIVQLPAPSEAASITASEISDPVLGPPYPPVFYYLDALTRDGQGTHLTWIIPDLLIEVEITSQVGGFVSFFITISNYEWPAWSGATTYIQNQRVTFGGVRYYSLQNGNLNNQPDISPLSWEVDTTVFELWWFAFDDTQTWVKIGDSNNSLGPAVWDWALLRWEVALVQNPALYTFYAKATVPDVGTVYSNEFGLPVS